MTESMEGAHVPGFVYELAAGAASADEVTLDTATLRDLADKVRDIEEARASAAVSGRDYLIR